jgi:hypothetical protein
MVTIATDVYKATYNNILTAPYSLLLHKEVALFYEHRPDRVHTSETSVFTTSTAYYIHRLSSREASVSKVTLLAERPRDVGAADRRRDWTTPRLIQRRMIRRAINEKLKGTCK